MLGNLWSRVQNLFSPKVSEEELRQQMDQLRDKTPIPVFWLFGKTQSGKSSLVRYLTGADKAEIGRGFQPCTKFSSLYHFPTEQAPLMTFLDTRGIGEPGYDPEEDIATFTSQAHVVVVTVKVLDHAQEQTLNHLKRIRRATPSRPILLVLTCLHEAYPQQQHPFPYPFTSSGELLPDGQSVSEELLQSLALQKERFGKLVDRIVLVDLTQEEEGFTEPNYGGAALRDTLLELLPAAQGQTLRTLEVAQRNLRDFYARKATPTIVAYTSLAATAGAVPIPVVDVLLISGVQTRMINDLAKLYGQPLTTQRMAELAGALGLGLVTRQAGRSLIKFIPGVGSVIGSMAGGALAAASTYALGQAFCYYYSAVLQGHNPDPKDLRRYYDDQFESARKAWQQLHKDDESPKREKSK